MAYLDGRYRHRDHCSVIPDYIGRLFPIGDRAPYSATELRRRKLHQLIARSLLLLAVPPPASARRCITNFYLIIIPRSSRSAGAARQNRFPHRDISARYNDNNVHRIANPEVRAFNDYLMAKIVNELTSEKPARV